MSFGSRVSYSDGCCCDYACRDDNETKALVCTLVAGDDAEAIGGENDDYSGDVAAEEVAERHSPWDYVDDNIDRSRRACKRSGQVRRAVAAMIVADDMVTKYHCNSGAYQDLGQWALVLVVDRLNQPPPQWYYFATKQAMRR